MPVVAGAHVRAVVPVVAGGALAAVCLLRVLAFLGTAPLATLEASASEGNGPPGEGPALLHIFQPEDCPGSRELVREWNDLHRGRALRVVGVGLSLPRDPTERARVVRQSGAAFPVRPDRGGDVERLALRLGYDRTPLAILLDARGRPRLVLPPLPGPDAPRRAARLVREAVAALAAERAGRSPAAESERVP